MRCVWYVLLFVWSVVALPPVHADTAADTAEYTALYVQFGEWQVARGSGASLIWDTPRWKAIPFVFLDGSVIEMMGLYHLTRSRLCISAGPVLGVLIDGRPIDGYAGFEIRGRYDMGGGLSVSTRYASRHTKDERLHNLTVAGLTYDWNRKTVGIAYEPIRTEEPLDHRIAVNGSMAFTPCTFIVEVRESLTTGYVTANLDVEIPISF